MVGAFILAQLPSDANDIEKVLNKAVGPGKSKLFSQVIGKGKAFAHPASEATPAVLAPSTPATSATSAGSAAPVAAIASPSGNAANPPVPGAQSAGAVAPHSTKQVLGEKVKKEAMRQVKKYGTKYGGKYLDQGGNQLGSFLK